MYVAGGWQTTAARAVRWCGVGGEFVHDCARPVRQERPSFPRKRESIFASERGFAPSKSWQQTYSRAGDKPPRYRGQCFYRRQLHQRICPVAQVCNLRLRSRHSRKSGERPSYPRTRTTSVIPAHADNVRHTRARGERPSYPRTRRASVIPAHAESVRHTRARGERPSYPRKRRASVIPAKAGIHLFF